MNSFTPTQQRILDLLSDGAAHTVKELTGCLYVDSYGALRVHIRNIRRELQKVGEDIACVYRDGHLHYCHIRYVSTR